VLLIVTAGFCNIGRTVPQMLRIDHRLVVDRLPRTFLHAALVSALRRPVVRHCAPVVEDVVAAPETVAADPPGVVAETSNDRTYPYQGLSLPRQDQAEASC